MTKQIIKFLSVLTTILALSVLLTGCKIGYSFTGASISPAVKSVFIDFQDCPNVFCLLLQVDSAIYLVL